MTQATAAVSDEQAERDGGLLDDRVDRHPAGAGPSSVWVGRPDSRSTCHWDGSVGLRRPGR